MTRRASLVLDTGRSPPRRSARASIEPERMEFSLSDHTRELAAAIAEIAELDRTIMQIDREITDQTRILETADAWDAIDAEAAIAALTDRRSKASWAVMFAANRAIFHANRLIDAWRDVDVDNIARNLSQDGPVFTRLRAEWPAIGAAPAWQRMRGEACPF